MKHFVHATVHNTVLLPHYNGDTIGVFFVYIASPFRTTTGPVLLVAYECWVSELLCFHVFQQNAIAVTFSFFENLVPSWVHMLHVIPMDWWSLRSFSTSNWTTNIWKIHDGSSCVLWRVVIRRDSWSRFAIKKPKQRIPAEDRRHPSPIQPLFCQAREKLKLYNKLVMDCAQRWSLVSLIVTCYQLGIHCNLFSAPDPERVCQSIECSWMGDIYFDFVEPPKEKINVRKEMGLFRTDILLRCSILC